MLMIQQLLFCMLSLGLASLSLSSIFRKLSCLCFNDTIGAYYMPCVEQCQLLAYVEGGAGGAVQLLRIPVVYIHGKMQHLAAFI